jgi:hypothetical protein
MKNGEVIIKRKDETLAQIDDYLVNGTVSGSLFYYCRRRTWQEKFLENKKKKKTRLIIIGKQQSRLSFVWFIGASS